MKNRRTRVNQQPGLDPAKHPMLFSGAYAGGSSTKRQEQQQSHATTTTNAQLRHRQGFIAILSMMLLVCISVGWNVHKSQTARNSEPQQQHHDDNNNWPMGSTTNRHVLYLQSQQQDESTNKNHSLLYSPGNRDRSARLGRHPLRLLLQNAGYDLQDAALQSDLERLPLWEDIVDQYGADPVIVGLDTECERFQALPDPAEHFISVAGTFNSGTNLLAMLLWENCYMVSRVRQYGKTNRGVRWQVPWGKHSPVDNETFRQSHRADNERSISADNVMAVVTIRDAYYWMNSMCRHSYEMWWPRSAHRCPNLVPSDDDPELYRRASSIPVRVKYSDGTDRKHLSMVHHYNEWYGGYLNASFPRLIVRYEDLIFRPRQVIEPVCACAGGRLVGSMGWKNKDLNNKDKTIPFYFVKNSAKDNSPVHGHDKTGLLQAMLQYSNKDSNNGTHKKTKNHNMTDRDIEYAQKHLDPKLLQLFRYKDTPS